MPEFKDSGTGYTEHKVGSDAFKSDKTAENRAVRGGENPPGFSDESDAARHKPNPDQQGGPQSY